jgi:EAL domain-containing protein (putative c-di-GMP-specific phosphodiesterase class I)
MQFDPVPQSPVIVAAFNTVMAVRGIRCVYQPIVHLQTEDVIGYEALARGPAHTSWQTPEALVNYAARVGRLPELDWICRAAAVRGAFAAEYPADMPLFVNVEPASSRTPCPDDLVEVLTRGSQELEIVAEVTERSVANDPAGLIAAIEVLRAHTNRIALDDVGSDVASQAMMSLIRPDVIKLDRGVIQAPDSPAVHAVVDAVLAEAKRTGAVILAEGIETYRHLDTARAMGATLGQGWLFGRPGPLPTPARPSGLSLPHLSVSPPSANTPFEIARQTQRPETATTDVLLPLSRDLEDKGVRTTESTVLLTAFRSRDHFDDATRHRYNNLAAHAILTATFGEDMPLQPGPNIRGCPLPAGDPLIGEWDVIVIGSQFAGAMFARERALGDGDRVFDLIVTYDRDVILAAARPLLDRLVPAG